MTACYRKPHMTKFSDLKLDPKVLKAVQEAGYEAPTPIQAGAIPPALEGRDVLGIAQTGTGKTAGFTLPMITRLARGRARARMPRSLVLCPTRELAAQVAENFDTYAKYTRLTKALLIGGVSFSEQDKLIDRGVDVLIATPGRLLDHFERGKLLLTGVEVMVVDEADRMLDMGFIPDIERIFQLTPFTRQTLFFSATMAPEIERITNTFLHAPERIEVARQATASETIEQRLIELTPTRKDQTAKQKRELLRALIDGEGEALKNAIIFCNRKTDVDIVSKSLRAHGYDAAAIHGDLDQSHRTKTLDDFREGGLRFLVASDVAARGLDIPAVSHVFNFDLPSHAEDYVHRIGRTGRAGREGVAISIFVPLDDKYLSAIESLLKTTLPRAPRPEGFVPSEGGRSSASRGEGEGRNGSRSRSRGGRGRGREDRAGASQPEVQPAPTEPVAEAPREPVTEAPREAAPRDGGDRRRTDGRNGRDHTDRARDDRTRERHGDRQGARGGRQGDRQRGDTAPGMGDHVPEFLTRSFLDALAATERGDAERAAAAAEAERKAAEAAARKAEAEAVRQAEAEARKKAEAEAAASTEAEPDTAPQAPATEPAAEEAPAKPRRRRSPAKPKATEEAAPPAEAEATEAVAEADPKPEVEAEAPKPRRTTRRKAAPVEDATAEGAAPTEAEAPAKPAPRRRKAAAKPEAEAKAGEAEAGETAEAPKKRRTTTRRKPAAEADPVATPDSAAATDSVAEAPAEVAAVAPAGAEPSTEG